MLWDSGEPCTQHLQSILLLRPKKNRVLDNHSILRSEQIFIRSTGYCAFAIISYCVVRVVTVAVVVMAAAMEGFLGEFVTFHNVINILTMHTCRKSGYRMVIEYF